MSTRFGIDVGGTFDLVLYDDASGPVDWLDFLRAGIARAKETY